MSVACTVEPDCPERFRSRNQYRCAGCRKPMCDYHSSADGSLCSECVVAQAAGKKLRVWQPKLLKTGRGSINRFHIGTKAEKPPPRRKRLEVGSVCLHGHTLTEQTLRLRKGGETRCGECEDARYARRKAAQEPE